MRRLTMILTVLACVSLASAAQWPTGASPCEVGSKLCQRFLSKSPERWNYNPKRVIMYWTVCTWYGALEYAIASGDKALEDRLIRQFEPLLSGDLRDCVPLPRHVDYSMFGCLPLAIGRRTGDERCKEMGLRFADQQWAPQPKGWTYDTDEGRAWLEKGYTPQTRLWMDDMFMITIVQLGAYLTTGDRKYADRASREMALYLDRLQNADGLFYHTKETPFVWARGDGWMAAGMAMLMKNLPKDDSNLPRIMAGYKLMMGTLLKHQRNDGLWGQLVDDPDSWAETSGSAMFAYAFIEGLRQGWLDEATYASAARRAYLALVGELTDEGDLKNVCVGTNAKNDRQWYIDRPRATGDLHGQAPLLWCCAALVSPRDTSARSIPEPIPYAQLPDCPPAVGGIDFWKEDGFHYATSPVRNVFRNPSFERGLLYWNYARGGGEFNVREPQDRYVIEEGGVFGGHCLHVLPTNRKVAGLRTFPMSLNAGKRYTLSCYVKSHRSTTVGLRLQNAAKDGATLSPKSMFGDVSNPESKFKIDPKDGWKRIQRTFTADAAGVMVFVSGDDCWFDAFQLEEGEVANEFVAPPIDASLVTSDPDNMLYSGAPSDFAVRLTGLSDAKATVTVTFADIYGEVVERQVLKDVSCGEHLLWRNRVWPWTGVFRVRYDIETSAGAYVQYERLGVVEPLSNRHPTKDFFACFSHCRTSRSEDIMRRVMEWGFGSTTWMKVSEYHDPSCAKKELYAKYRFQNYLTAAGALTNYVQCLFPDLKTRKELVRAYRAIEHFETNQLKVVDEAVYAALNSVDPSSFPYVALSNEEESSPIVNGATDGGLEYGMIQQAFFQAAKRANPAYRVTPTHGTSGWNCMRGRIAYENYLNAANKLGFRYDAVSVHPYGNGDGGTLCRYDGDAEMSYMRLLLERYGYDPVKTPILLSECYNQTVAYIPQWGCGTHQGQDAYGWGKTGYDFGNREFQDCCQLSRMYLVHMKYWPQVKCIHCWLSPYIDASIRPRACALAVNTIGRFLPDPTFVGDARIAGCVRAYVWRQGDHAVAAVWAVDTEAEWGRRRCPSLDVAFSQPVKFYDMMGNRRRAAVEREAGCTGTIPLSSAPLYVIADDAGRLVDDFRKATSSEVEARIAKSKEALSSVVPASVPVCDEIPDWSAIPVHSLSPVHRLKTRGFAADCQYAWNSRALFIRVSVKDPDVSDETPERKSRTFARNLYRADGALELYLDCGANGRINAVDYYDADDYRYDFAPPERNASGRGLVYRFVEVDHQLADGINMPTREEAAEKIGCAFTRKDDGYEYVIRLDQRYVEPIMLRAGAKFALSLVVHNKRTDDSSDTLSNVGKPGVFPNGKPSVWPLFVLSDSKANQPE